MKTVDGVEIKTGDLLWWINGLNTKEVEVIDFDDMDRAVVVPVDEDEDRACIRWCLASTKEAADSYIKKRNDSLPCPHCNRSFCDCK